MASRSRSPKYSTAEKRNAISLGKEVGPAKAARQLGMPLGTLTCWMYKARQAQARGEDWLAPQKGEQEARPTSAQEARPTSAQEAPSPSSAPVPAPAKTATSRRVARRYTPSQKAEILEQAACKGVSATAKALGVSRYSIYDWKRKVERAAAGQGPSPTSGPSA